MAEVDDLSVKISAQATQAVNALGKLNTQLKTLSASLNGINGSGLVGLASGVQKLGAAMQTMNTVKTADFSRLARNLNNISTVDTASLNRLASATRQISSAFSGLSGMNTAATQMTELANGIKQLGYKSADKAITNIPQLATAMKQLMTTLSTAPKVSSNLISMKNALANLTRTGAATGTTAKSLSSSLNVFSKSAKTAKVSTFSLASAIGKLYATYWVFFRAFSKIGDAIDISSDLTEVQNVVTGTFAQYEDVMNEFAENSIQNYGMSELTAKEIGSRFQAMGVSAGYARGEMAEMSTTLTALAGDMASFYNKDAEDVATALNSIFTGETEPMRRFGVDLTNATVQEWALNKGIQANMSTMTNYEKIMLRYQYTLEATTDASGDFARTAGRLCAA